MTAAGEPRQRVLRWEATPNPNAQKGILAASISDRPRSFRDAAAAEDDALASALFAVPGVRNLLLCGTWMTVGKEETASWPAVRRGVEGVLEALA